MLVEANHYGKFYTEQMYDNKPPPRIPTRLMVP